MSPPFGHPAHDQSGAHPARTRLAGVLADGDGLAAATNRLALELGLPVLDRSHADVSAAQPVGSRAAGITTDAQPTAILVWSTSGLELRCAMGTVRVDFLSGREAVRVRHGSGRREPLGRALGLRAAVPTRSVLDATAGLGRDTFLLACLGAEVFAVERDPVVGALVRDALDRGALDPGLAGPMARIQLRIGDALSVLADLPPGESPDAIYLDPMFPPRRKSSLVKKEMRILSQLVGGTTPDGDMRELLHAALAVARRRVVVKRPADAAPIEAPHAPDHAVPGGRTTRYDVWIC